MSNASVMFPQKERLKTIVKAQLGDDWEVIMPFNVTGWQFRRNFNKVFTANIEDAPISIALNNMIEFLEKQGQ